MPRIKQGGIVETKPGADAPELAVAVEAILFSLDRPIPASRICEVVRGSGGRADGVDEGSVDAAVEWLNSVYDGGGRAFRVERVAGGLRVMARPEHASLLAVLHQTRASQRLSRAAVETLAIVAYKQPITRARLEAVRGCACGEVLRTLMDRRLVTIKGRAEELGRPMLYGTTKEFLDAFGLSNLKDLPSAEELKAGL